ncbi:sigma-70 family RNA polymerase sigma factor [Sphingomonas morindae]|uniref:Sigma-70 family RNA polymerase sigma factor n=1 Tax=Sphingomonas morindae TaxID=1541170 RepID=A0ABY4XAF2_9SPHN|nr:sigma-70 family RNA polymerase sigma factor [Sphingomonas morindae]USI73661.1 sigma-70 family RNA polymerase sigma factor [Sphingomonas morindae]
MTQIFLHQRPGLIRYAAARMGDRAEAEDLIQEAWLLFNAVSGTRPLAEPERYLRRIVRNLVIDRSRRTAVEQRLFQADPGGAAEASPSGDPSALAAIVAREELDLVRQTMAAMPERMRRAVEMHRIQGVTLVEIGARLSISKSRAHELVVEGLERCRRALRRAP